MTTVEAKCKFCGKVLHLQVDLSYMETGDKFNLLSLAACNACADAMTLRRRWLDPLHKLCCGLAQGVYKGEQLEKVRSTVEGYLKRHLRHLAETRKVNVPDWDESILESVLKEPARYGNVLNRMPRLFAQQELLTK